MGTQNSSDFRGPKPFPHLPDLATTISLLAIAHGSSCLEERSASCCGFYESEHQSSFGDVRRRVWGAQLFSGSLPVVISSQHNAMHADVGVLIRRMHGAHVVPTGYNPFCVHLPWFGRFTAGYPIEVELRNQRSAG